MAYQTSKILQDHSTPRSIGRLMDADFSVVVLLSHRTTRRGCAAKSDPQATIRSSRPDQTALVAHLPWAQNDLFQPFHSIF